jgi:hypothetical protein
MYEINDMGFGGRRNKKEKNSSKATVEYWYNDLSHITGYGKGHEIEEADIPKVTMEIFSKGLNVMLYHLVENKVIIWVDDKRFGQRG